MKCVYCNKKEATTNDHCPPQSLFPKPLPNDLITVPCCEICNKSFQKDDDYIYKIFTMKDEIYNNKNAKEVFEKALKSYQRTQSKKLTRSILKTVRMRDVYSISGLYLGKRPTYIVDAQRIRNFAIRIVIGLYYHEFNKIFDKNTYKIQTYLTEDIEKDLYVLNLVLNTFMPALSQIKPRKIYDGSVFLYKYLSAYNKEDCMIWALLFYQKFPVIGLIIPKSISTDLS